MFGGRTPVYEAWDTEWVHDPKRSRLVNKQNFTQAQNYIYDKQYLPRGLRPDMTDFGQFEFHWFVKQAHNFRIQLRGHILRESLKFKMFSNFNDYTSGKNLVDMYETFHPGKGHAMKAGPDLEKQEAIAVVSYLQKILHKVKAYGSFITDKN